MLTANGEQARSSGRIAFWCVVILVGLLQVWAHRNDMNPDGISYIEIAQTSVHVGLRGLVNGYWSPLYPFLLSIVFRIFHPAIYWEFTAAHLLNFAIYLASFAAFEVFLSELILVLENLETAGGNETQQKGWLVSQRMLRIWGYLLFLWASEFWLGPSTVTPDLCVAAFAFLATAILLRINRKYGWRDFAILGIVLGFGYLAKAAMFPLAFIFLGSAFLLSGIHAGSYWRATAKSLCALAIFSMIAAPWIITLSKTKHRLTFGESGKINYTTFVNRAPRDVHWQGEPFGTGVPAHPTRIVFSDPRIYEFACPINGSYPPWYDPSYWYEGVTPHFSIQQQLSTLFRSVNVYFKMFSKSGVLYFVLLAFLVLVRRGGLAKINKEIWLVFLPSCAMLVMYALVLVEFRYVSASALMLLLLMVFRVRLCQEQKSKLLRSVMMVSILAPAIAIGWAVGRDSISLFRNLPYEQWEVAQGLRDAGIPAGTDVGYIGTGLDAYWAHLAGVRIIAEIPDKERASFITAEAAKRQKALEKFAEVGAKMIVTRYSDIVNSDQGWRQIQGTHYYVRELNN